MFVVDIMYFLKVNVLILFSKVIYLSNMFVINFIQVFWTYRNLNLDFSEAKFTETLNYESEEFEVFFFFFNHGAKRAPNKVFTAAEKTWIGMLRAIGKDLLENNGFLIREPSKG